MRLRQKFIAGPVRQGDPAQVLSRVDRIVYGELVDAAQNGAPCPLNLDLEALFGYRSASQGARLIRRLEERGLIVVERYQRFRRVQIVATGKWTAFASSQRTYGAHVPRGARSLRRKEAANA